MGKAGNASGAEAKTAGGSKDAKTGSKAKEADAKQESPETAAKVKLVEEASQALADDEKTERSRVEFLEQNRKIASSGSQLKGNRDKSLARVTKFQNKLKLFKGEPEYSGIEKDIDGTDASKYVSELADCLVEAAGVSLKLKEMPSGVKVCTRLRATYDEFAGHLAQALRKSFDSTASTDLNRRRFLLRFCVELVLVECIPASDSPLVDMMKQLTDGSLPEETLVVNFTILSSLVQKHAVSCLNIIPEKQRTYEETLGRTWCERSCVLEDSLRTQLQQLVVNAYQSCAGGLLQTAHARLLEQEKLHTKLRVDKGQVDAENVQKHEQLKDSYMKLHSNLTTLSEYLNQPMATAEEEDPNASRIVGRQEKVEEKEEELPDIWESAEQQRFYEEVMDPKDVIPAVLLQSGKKETEKTDGQDEDGEAEEEGDAEADVVVKTGEELKKEKEEARAQKGSDYELYLARVQKCVSAKEVDDIVIEFFHEWNTKGNRRLLAQHLFKAPRQKLHILGPHSRLLATVASYAKDIPLYVLTGLKKELAYIKSEKDPVKLESKVRTVMFLCELCKFKVCPPGVILDMFKDFLDDFTAHHAELCATILQTCGRFLLYTPETGVRTDNLLERMLRLKNSKSLGLAVEVNLEDAYYKVKPPESKRKAQKECEPMERFIHHIVYDLLSKEENEDKVLKLIRKLPWEEGPAKEWLLKALLDLNMHSNYEHLYLVASLLSGLAKYRDAFVIDVVDTIFEHIQSTIERNDFRQMPVRVRQIKLVGELYNFRLVSSGEIFDMLYMLIGFAGPTPHKAGQAVTAHRVLEKCLAARKGGLGAISEEAAEKDESSVMQLPAIFADPQHSLEAPWDYFRIKLVCVLLETCGHFFDTGRVRPRLDRFINFFCRYVHSKGELPLRFMNMVYDTLEVLRPKFVFPKTKEDADQQVIKLMQGERATLDLNEDKPEAEEEAEGDESSGDEEDDSDEGEESESEESEEEDSEEEEEEEEYNRQGAADPDHKTQHEQELEDFEKEIQQILIDSLDREKHAPRSAVDLPDQVQTMKKPEGVAAPGAFTLIQKKAGGKMVTKAIDVPEDSKLANVCRSRVEEKEAEHRDVKRFIMQYDPNDARGQEAAMPFRIHVRQGKGSGKNAAQLLAARAAPARVAPKHEYLQSDFLPEDEPQLPAPGTTIRFSGGMGKGGSFGGGGGRGGGGKGKGEDRDRLPRPPESFSSYGTGSAPTKGNLGAGKGCGKSGKGKNVRDRDRESHRGTPSSGQIRSEF